MLPGGLHTFFIKLAILYSCIFAHTLTIDTVLQTSETSGEYQRYEDVKIVPTNHKCIMVSDVFVWIRVHIKISVKMYYIFLRTRCPASLQRTRLTISRARAATSAIVGIL